MDVFIICILIFSVLSFSLNGALIWYARKIIQKHQTSKNAEKLIFQTIQYYMTHLQAFDETMNLFGDQTMVNVKKHTKSMLELLKFYKEHSTFQNVEEALNKEYEQEQELARKREEEI